MLQQRPDDGGMVGVGDARVGREQLGLLLKEVCVPLPLPELEKAPPDRYGVMWLRPLELDRPLQRLMVLAREGRERRRAAPSAARNRSGEGHPGVLSGRLICVPVPRSRSHSRPGRGRAGRIR